MVVPEGLDVSEGDWLMLRVVIEDPRDAAFTAVAAQCRRVAGVGERLWLAPRDMLRLQSLVEGHEGETLNPPAEPRVSIRPDLPAEALFELPVVRPPKPDSEGHIPAAPANPRVLVVDDDPGICDVLCALLEEAGLSADVSSSAERAWARLEGTRYQLLILDWRLPAESGLDLCRRVRQRFGPTQPAIMILTGEMQAGAKLDALSSGADDYVAKPFRAPELLARVFGLLQRAV